MNIVVLLSVHFVISQYGVLLWGGSSGGLGGEAAEGGAGPKGAFAAHNLVLVEAQCTVVCERRCEKHVTCDDICAI